MYGVPFSARISTIEREMEALEGAQERLIAAIQTAPNAVQKAAYLEQLERLDEIYSSLQSELTELWNILSN